MNLLQMQLQQSPQLQTLPKSKSKMFKSTRKWSKRKGGSGANILRSAPQDPLQKLVSKLQFHSFLSKVYIHILSKKVMRVIGYVQVPSENSVDTLTEFEVPKPTATGRDLLVKIKGAATNPVDIKVVNWAGAPGHKLEAPLVIGYDAAGVVESVGDDVSLFKVGDEVIFAGAIQRSGTFAEYTVVDERIVGRKPRGLTWTQAATIPLTFLTAYESLAFQLKLQENPQEEQKSTILIVGGAGGVGSFAIQLAKKVFGLEVIATASREKTTAYCKKLGADFIINHRNDLKKELEAIERASSVSLILDCYGLNEQLWDTYMDILVPFGKLCSIFPAAKVDLMKSFHKSLTFTSTLMFTRPATGVDIEAQHNILNRAAELVENGVIDLTLEKEFPFTVEGVHAALKTHLEQNALGKNGISFE
jgi:NADPH2:quinone reductase